MNHSTNSEKLQKALDLLGPNGENWRKGMTSNDPPNTYCGYEAVTVALGGSRGTLFTGEDKRVFEGCCRALRDAGFRSTWQDLQWRTFSEVREVFQKAIAAEKAKESQ